MINILPAACQWRALRSYCMSKTLAPNDSRLASGSKSIRTLKLSVLGGCRRLRAALMQAHLIN
ncbi:hypothetical protein BDZ45DRAFT_755548 [Acephala macrosclerotiorum]|nr:hypothetical protein BDZ45DRAFT_755548 [Acephala macrosclerotiorum]